MPTHLLFTILYGCGNSSDLGGHTSGSTPSAVTEIFVPQYIPCLFCFMFTECNAECSSSPVFEMIYERNPVRCKFERRLEVNTSPLNIIYNPQAIKKVTEFFYKGRVHTSGRYYSVLPCFMIGKVLHCSQIESTMIGRMVRFL